MKTGTKRNAVASAGPIDSNTSNPKRSRRLTERAAASAANTENQPLSAPKTASPSTKPTVVTKTKSVRDQGLKRSSSIKGSLKKSTEGNSKVREDKQREQEENRTPSGDVSKVGSNGLELPHNGSYISSPRTEPSTQTATDMAPPRGAQEATTEDITMAQVNGEDLEARSIDDLNPESLNGTLPQEGACALDLGDSLPNEDGVDGERGVSKATSPLLDPSRSHDVREIECELEERLSEEPVHINDVTRNSDVEEREGSTIDEKMVNALEIWFQV